MCTPTRPNRKRTGINVGRAWCRTCCTRAECSVRDLHLRGKLAPEKFFGSLFHTDAGLNIARAYILTPSEHVAKGIMNKDGEESLNQKPSAGFQAEPVDLIKAADHWFRPDVCACRPDGSVYISIGMTRALAGIRR